MPKRVHFLVEEDLLKKFDGIAKELRLTRTELLVILMKFIVNARENPMLIYNLAEYFRNAQYKDARKFNQLLEELLKTLRREG